MRDLIMESKAERMFKDVKHIASFGNRFAGSKADFSAAEYIAKDFEEQGLEVIKEDFPIIAFSEEESYVEVLGENNKITSRAMFYSVSTPREGLTGELVFVGKGLPEDYLGKDVKDKIVIFHRDTETEKDQFWPEICTAARNGAKAAILINFTPWIFITTLETGLFDANKRFLPIEPNPIPALVINSLDGEKILRSLETSSVKVNMVVNTKIEDGYSTNVRAIKNGIELPKEKIIVYGHRDSAGTPGANDNGSGTAILMELGRILSKYSLKRTVEIISIGAEEQLGSVGSLSYIKKHEDELSNIKAGFEVDMVAAGSNLSVITGGNWPDKEIRFPEKLCTYVVETAEKLGYYLDYGFCSLGTPDSGRFMDAGVPTTWIWGSGDIYYHSPEDKPERVDPNKLKALADTLATAIINLANADEISW